MSTDNKLTRTQREILKMMADGRELKCRGNPEITTDVWIGIRDLSRKTLVSLINSGLVQIEKLGKGSFAPEGHTVLTLTDKGRESINPANKKV